MKVHIVLAENADYTSIIAALNLKHYNKSRLKKHGILSGDLDDQWSLQEILLITGVKSVMIDNTKNATS